jgi:predicted esterase
MEKVIDFEFKAQYFQSSGVDSSTKEIWFVVHGYGQLAKHFIKKFNPIATSERVIVAPGGLSRFYLEGFNGRVGATWMTKEDRLLDIDNYVSYLNKIYEEVSGNLVAGQRVDFHFLGFSQGAATVTRWLQWHEHDFKRLIVWAGSFPHDMEVARLSEKLKGKEVVMVRGTLDPFIDADSIEQQRLFISSLAIDVTHLAFDGKHEIDKVTLLALAGI